jgi:hypothetical protein
MLAGVVIWPLLLLTLVAGVSFAADDRETRGHSPAVTRLW